MPKLLCVQASPRGERSVTIRLADQFVAAYRQTHPDAVVDSLQLWEANLPEYDGDSAAAKMSFFGDPAMTARQKSVYEQMVAIFNRFNAADDYVFAVPMWNFGVPYKLKQYIDLLTMPGTLFGFDPAQGYIGLLKDKRATAIYSAGVYEPGKSKAFGADHVSTHFTDWLNFAGVTDVRSIWYYAYKMKSPADAQASFETAAEEARAAGRR